MFLFHDLICFQHNSSTALECDIYILNLEVKPFWEYLLQIQIFIDR